MKCPRCQSQNCEGVRFCEECGGRLVTTCASCGAELLPDKRFCGSCGSPATPEPVERQGPFPSKGPPSGTGLCELNEFAPSGGDMRHRLLGRLFGPGGDSCQLE